MTSNQRLRRSGAFAASAALLAIAGCGCSDSLGQKETTTVSFSQATSDERLLRSIGTEVDVGAVYVSTAGITAMYRPPTKGLAAAVLPEARARLVADFRTALDICKSRLRERFSGLTKEQVRRDAGKLDDFESLSTLHAQLEGILGNLETNEPVIFALELDAPAALIHEPSMRGLEARTFSVSKDGLKPPGNQLSVANVSSFDSRWQQLMSGLEADEARRTVLAPPSERALFAPVPPGWWPNDGDFFYDGGKYFDSTFKWSRLDGPWGLKPGDNPVPGYEHSLTIRGAIADGCTLATTLPNRYVDCATSVSAGDVNYKTYRIGTTDLKVDPTAVTLNKRYWGMWSLTTQGGQTQSLGFLRGHRTRRPNGCSTYTCVDATKSARFIAQGNWIIQQGLPAFGSWTPSTAWEITRETSDDE